MRRRRASSRRPVGRSLADPTSRLRDVDGAVVAFDGLLRHEPTAAALRPDVIVRVGRPAASRVLAEWVAGSGATLVQVGGAGPIDPDHTAVARLDPSVLGPLGRRLSGVGDAGWRRQWVDADETAEAAIDGVLGPEAPLTEPAVARLVARALPDDAELVVASSMPVRDLEWFGGRPARAHANRGANGIDGVVSTALGVALRRAANGRPRRRHRLRPRRRRADGAPRARMPTCASSSSTTTVAGSSRSSRRRRRCRATGSRRCSGRLTAPIS